MDETTRLLEEAILELQAALKRTRAVKARAHIERGLALVNEAHHRLTT